ncbi:hypothetical protein ABIB25_002718 [Nakamurella sp. UYEF19]|uniref:hypothetical protein n=1 Tax=Nakamurella sp. UYEF19 TaxID=1756392 RepID=UPI003399596D
MTPLPDDRSGAVATARRWVERASVRSVFVVAAVLTVIALALPWQAAQLTTSVSPTFFPGSCITTYDGSLDCLPGFVGFSAYSLLHPPQPGFSQPVRVFAVLAGLLMWQAVRRRVDNLAIAGLACAVLGLAGAGLSPRSGPAVYVLALIVAVIALRRVGLLRHAGLLGRVGLLRRRRAAGSARADR